MLIVTRLRKAIGKRATRALLNVETVSRGATELLLRAGKLRKMRACRPRRDRVESGAASMASSLQRKLFHSRSTFTSWWLLSGARHRNFEASLARVEGIEQITRSEALPLDRDYFAPSVAN